MDVTLSTSARTSIRALQQISEQITATQRRLATGKRVATAFDDPAAFFTASALNARAMELNKLMDTMGTAQKTIEASSAGITGLQSLLKSAESVARQALTATATAAKVVGTTTVASAGQTFTWTNGRTLTVSDGTTTATYTWSAGANTYQHVIDAVNNTANIKIRASLSADGRLQFEALDGSTITIAGTSSSSEKTMIGHAAGATTGSVSTARQSLAQQFEALRTQLDQAVKDAGYAGVNLLDGGSLAVATNETGTSKFTVAGVQITAAGLGLAAPANQFQTDADVNAAIANVSRAVTALAAHSTVLASNMDVVKARQDFTRSMIDTLKAGADDLLLSDTSEDSALLLALQTREQIAATALSMAHGSDQTALRLFRF